MIPYVKSGSTLYKDTPAGKLYATTIVMNTDIANIAENEVVFVENVGVYQKVEGVMNPILVGTGGGTHGNIGDFVYYWGVTNPDPDHLLVCNGATFDTTEFPELYALLGTNTTPDLNGYSLRGTGENSGLSTHDIIALGTKQASRVAYHLHDSTVDNHRHSTNEVAHSHSFSNPSMGICRAYPERSACVCFYYRYSGSASSTSSFNTCACTPSFSVSCVTPSISIGNACNYDSNNPSRVGAVTKNKTMSMLILIRGRV